MLAACKNGGCEKVPTAAEGAQVFRAETSRSRNETSREIAWTNDANAWATPKKVTRPDARGLARWPSIDVFDVSGG